MSFQFFSMYYTLCLKELPFEQLEKQIIYVEGQYNEAVNEYLSQNYDRIRRYFAFMGYDFCYMPKLAEELASIESIGYNAPYLKEKLQISELASNYLLNFMVHPENKEKVPPSLVHYKSDEEEQDKNGKSIITHLYSGISITEDTDYRKTSDLSNVLLNLITRPKIRFSKVGPAEEIDSDILFRDGDKQDNFSLKEEDDDEKVLADELFDEESKQVIVEIKERLTYLEKKGIKRYMLDKYLNETEKLSRLQITTDYRILLPDYKKEIEMGPLPKAVFLLFLKHPEGIMFSFLPDFRDELIEIYRAIKGSYFNIENAQKSIEDVTNPLSNSINEKCSRVREAFVKEFEDHLAKNYYIDGKRGEPKKISLPLNLVEWNVEPPKPKGLERKENETPKEYLKRLWDSMYIDSF